jgi:ubiquitin C-terminal hydrolase
MLTPDTKYEDEHVNELIQLKIMDNLPMI